MTPRADIYKASPEVFKAWYALSQKLAACGLEPSLLELVKIRSSQINGCANCLNMHTAEARRAGETEQRLHLLAAWHEAPCYSERERAALDWTDHMTDIATKRAPDAAYAALAAQFTPAEQVELTLAINVINGWNRLAVGFNVYAPEMGWQ
ncbi:carboxymuconolactone decarboxylase family protein [Novosphingobium terrae]|uniref:carboxymuconolactone decarboxylase family protein n=1 Tax=Novosphingobium terrae TaxID=2726189 RepID=UPI0019827274|nr:carboxymuconolactone decarboxylase family protein [Novosphingobium terrae]